MEMCETCQPATVQLGLLPADSLASLSVLPGSEAAQAMTVGSGRKWLELSSESDPLGCLARMCLESSAWNSTRCYLIWNVSVTPHKRLLFRLSASMPRTEGTGFGLWPTPTVSSQAQVAWDKTPGQTGGTTLKGAVLESMGLWPTPTKAISDGGQSSRSGKRKGELLLTGMARMFPTPTTQDASNNGGASQMNRNTLPLNAVVGGSLNPTWVEWLMGYPAGWTDLEG